jgi:hypothetical protein
VSQHGMVIGLKLAPGFSFRRSQGLLFCLSPFQGEIKGFFSLNFLLLLKFVVEAYHLQQNPSETSLLRKGGNGIIYHLQGNWNDLH